MLSVAEEFIDRITAVFHYLRVGKAVELLDIPADLPDNELRQLMTYVNRFFVEFNALSATLAQMALGELDTRPVASRMAAVQSLKTLNSNLRHLTWKTQQVAAGDLEQKVDFMGDFSTAFNSMTRQLKDSREQLLALNQQLEARNRFIRETFGRYTSDDIVEVLLDMPEGLKLGGEKRELTILMSDLRGFTAMVERLEPATVVALLNHYLSAMIEVIQRHGGTIDEIIGDAILVLFGAPARLPDAPRRAVACALEMQQAIERVNAHNVHLGWPAISIGEEHDLVLAALDANAQGVFLARNMLGFLGEVHRFQLAEYLLQFFEEEFGVVKRIVVHHHHLMGGGVLLREDGGQVLFKVMGFVAGADDDAHRVGLRLEFVFRLVQQETQEEKKMVKEMDGNGCAQQYIYDERPLLQYIVPVHGSE